MMIARAAPARRRLFMALPVAAFAALAMLAPVLTPPAAAQGAAEASQTDLIVSHGISAFGELKYPADFTHFDYANPDAPKGGEIRLRPTSGVRTFDSFNPYVVRGDPADGSEHLYDSLMVRAFDEPDALYGLVAESVAMPEDRSFAIFTLRKEARFSDGSPLTAEDVVFSITALRDQGAPIVALPLRQVESIEALGPHEVRVDFKDGATTRDLPARVAEMPIFSKAFFETHDFTAPTIDTPPLSSGAYRVGDVAQGRSVTYELREDYWAKDLPVRRGQFNFEELTFEYFPSADLALEAFKSGVIDFTEEFYSAVWATKYTFDSIDKGWVIKTSLPDFRPAGTQGYWINTRRAKFADRRTREAIALAFDFEWSNDKLFHHLYKRTDSFFENSDLQAEGEPSAAELALLEPFRDNLPEEVFGPAVSPEVSDGSGADRRLLRRASRLLKAAGWSVENGVLRNDKGEALEIEFLDRANSGFDRITRPFMRNLEQLGITATLRGVDNAQYERRVDDSDYDVTVTRLAPAATPGPSIRGMLASSSRDAAGSYNRAGIANPAIDAMLDHIEAASSRDELRTAASALDRIFRAEHYWVPNWYKAEHNIAYWDKFGKPQDLGLEKPLYDRGVILTWWFDADRADALKAKMAQ